MISNKWLSILAVLCLGPVACSERSDALDDLDEPPVDRIVGGQTATQHDYRWMVSLRDGDDKHFCGGALIAERWVATAAHCVCDSVVGSVVVGGFDKSNPSDGTRKWLKQTIVHPGFACGDPGSRDDVALLELNGYTNSPPIAINDDPQFPEPVALAAASATADNAVAIGWGLDENGLFPDKLKDVQVPVVTNADCDAAYGSIVDGQVCAGHTLGGEDACIGDSGGPLIAYDYSQPFLVGVTSFGVGCALPGFPGVYGRVSAYVEWFRSQGVPFTTRSDLERSSAPDRIVGLGGVTNATRRRHLFARTSGSSIKYYGGDLSTTWSREFPPGSTSSDFGDVAALQGPERGDFGMPHHAGFARRSDGALVAFEKTAAGPWLVEDATAIASGLPIDGDPFVTRGTRTNAGEETRHVFATGAGLANQPGSIIHYFDAPSLSWFSEDLSWKTGADPDERAVGRLAVLNSAGMANPGGRSQHVYFRGPADNLVQYYWSKANGWAKEDLTDRLESEGDLGGADVRIVGDPVAVNGDSAHNHGVRSQHVFAANATGNLAHYYWTNVNSWAAEDLTDLTGAGSDGVIDGTPMVINGPIRGNAGVRSMHVFARNPSDHLIHYYWINYQGWSFEDLTASFGAGETIEGDPRGFIASYVGNSGVQDIHIFARRGIDLIHYWWINFQGWQAENISDSLTAPPAVNDPLVPLLGPQKGNLGITSHHVYTMPLSIDAYSFDWINFGGWDSDWLGFP